MKKLIVLIAVVLVAINLSAQNRIPTTPRPAKSTNSAFDNHTKYCEIEGGSDIIGITVGLLNVVDNVVVNIRVSSRFFAKIKRFDNPGSYPDIIQYREAGSSLVVYRTWGKYTKFVSNGTSFTIVTANQNGGYDEYLYSIKNPRSETIYVLDAYGEEIQLTVSVVGTRADVKFSDGKSFLAAGR